MGVQFEWDAEKAALNLRKHGVSEKIMKKTGASKPAGNTPDDILPEYVILATLD